jgi:hypothetical protein
MHSTTLFPDLPDQARLWIYSVDAPLNSETKRLIKDQLDRFVSQWHSHGRKVNGRFALLENRFILIAADIPDADISGCGIDASVHALSNLGLQLGFSLLTGLHICYRDREGQVTHTSRPDFRKMVRDEVVNGDTQVFDTSLTLLSQWREGAFELPARASWHAQVFRIPSPAS